MKISISTRHCELSEDLKQRTEERLNKLQRFFDRIMDARVVVSFEKNRYNAEGVLTANGTPLTSKAVDDTDHRAVEQVLDKLEAQVRRHKDRLKSKSRRRAGVGEALPEMGGVEEEAEVMPGPFDESDLDNLISDDAGDFSVAMPVAEAAAQLKVSAREALGFTNSLTGKKILLFKRRDGNIGVVDIQSLDRS